MPFGSTGVKSFPRADFATPNILDVALQHYCTLVAICGFLRRNLHERIARSDEGPAISN
jgi:hypothetical protein